MGIKKAAQVTETTTHQLTDAEFNYVMNIQTAKQNIVDEYNRVISSFLKYVSSSRLEFDPNTDLQFELDFSDDKHELKITKLPPQALVPTASV